MPSISRITATFFTTLINRLGIRPPPPAGFELSSVVQPVSIVDSDISLSAVLTTLTLDVPATGGEIVSPAAGAVLADSGALAAGIYNFLIVVADAPAGGNFDFRIQRRDAANAVNVWTQIFHTGVNGVDNVLFAATIKLLLNERVRVVNIATTLGDTVQASIWQSLVTPG
jgi:hypothetical protein